VDYDFSRLNPRDFEHMVQSLALAELGPSLTVFGDGPDNGREATFDAGAMLSGGDVASAYGVLQAKFRQRPVAGKDATWLLEQIDGEVRDYLRAGSRRRRPDALVIATNVVLTPGHGGGLDRVRVRMERASAQLGLRAWRVWAYDDLRARLDGNKPVRRTYAAWITPGDVLHEIIERLELDQPDFEQTISTFLQKELLADQYVNFEQAGHAVAERLQLGGVFFDVPIELDAHERARGGQGRAPKPAGCVAHLLALASRRIDPEARRDAQAGPRPPKGEAQGAASHATGRAVLVGGPGQGKSTVGQFLCQLHRLALLETRDPATIAPEVARALDTIADCAKRDGLPRPAARRFPVRVTLNAFAAALADERGPNGLLEYVALRIRERTGETVSPALLRRWFGEHPWLVVLDGLDEVPLSSNRDAVLSAVEGFWVDAAVAKSDVLMVATTRPQGYNDDFSPQLYPHLRLRPLDAKQAVRYGVRLAEQRYAGDQDRCAKVVERLRRAARVRATRPLMETPLQVTIMTALVDRVGRPPEERWSLFQEYYDVVYQREIEREIPAAEILRGHRADVDAIHQRTALLLQLRSEHLPQVGPRLSPEELAAVVEQRLAEEGYEEPQRSTLRREILEAAAQRLVFLVGLQHDSIGFEIRSLQEYMAAECLMDGPDERVVERLGAIAGLSSWRGVLLFAAGHCFARREHLRDTVFRICTEMNVGDDPLARSRLLGAGLAADLLRDGPARRHPRYAKLFAREALRSLRDPGWVWSEGLADLHDEVTDPLFRTALEEVVREPLCHGPNGWRTLLELDARGVGWARELIDRCWPSDPDDVVTLLRHVEQIEFQGDLDDRFLAAVAQQPCEAISRDLELVEPLVEAEHEPAWWSYVLVSDDPEAHLRTVSVLLGERTAWRTLVAPVDAWFGALRDTAGLHRSWQLMAAAERFALAPSAERLAAALTEVGERLEPAEWRNELHALPWPLRACVAFAVDRAELERLARAARAGELGGPEAWRAAEARWASGGVDAGDLVHTAALADLPFDADVGRVGFPLSMVFTVVLEYPSRELWRRLRALAAEMGGTRNAALFASCLRDLVAATDPMSDVPFAEFAAWSEAAGGWPASIGARRFAAWLSDGSAAIDAARFDAFGRASFSARPLFPVLLDEAGPARLAAAIEQEPERGGMWCILASLLPLLGADAAREIASGLARVPWPRDRLGAAAAASVALHRALAVNEAAVVASAIADAAAEHPDHVASILHPPDSGGSPALELIVGLLAEALPCEQFELREQVAGIANGMVMRRRSVLGQAERWEELGLFARDERLLHAP